MALILTFKQSQDDVAKLVKHFSTNRTAFLAPTYKEAQARQELIDPLFMALGWDVRNEGHAAPQYREVIVEPSQDVEGKRKAPDYAFRVGRDTVFYAEAKKPSVAIKDEPLPAYQLRRYAWSAKLPLSVLTDFHELAVYDCRMRPKESDKVSVGRVNYYTFEEYPDVWREIWDRFSREAVLSGSFDQFALATKGKRGTTEVDAEFLREIEGWRDALARNLALRNERLSVEDLNDAVQRTIDRIIFLRMAEDRGMEDYERLRRLADRKRIYPALMDLCLIADRKYNSGLFDFSAKGDRLTPKLSIDDKVLKDILAGLYFPQSPYEFSVLPAVILGNVYEQFLGKVIHLTKGHHAKVEDKPEVKKAGGVYYTPDYIVDYIVKNTVGKMIEGKTPTQLKGFRVLDMACGSGSFLLGAYQCLLDHYLRWYSERSPGRHKTAVWKRAGEWRLTVAEKNRILKSHIFGVDIDRQAVEVTKLSLLLKAVESETNETLDRQKQLLTLWNERVLPNLDENVKCGNSLIGTDYFAGQLLPDAGEMKRVNPFDWDREFPDAMESGGFDCIIGNPPYIRIQALKEWAPLEVEIYKEKYAAASSGNYDIYVVFVEKGLSLLNKSGRLGFILPHKFFNSRYGKALRSLISSGKHLSHVVHFGDQQVFVGATTYTCLMFLDKAGASECRFSKVADLSAWRTSGKADEGDIASAAIADSEWNFTVGSDAALFEKLNKMPVKLGDVAHIFVGLQTSADTVFLFKGSVKDVKRLTGVYSQQLGREVLIESALLKPVVRSGEIGRYTVTATAHVLFPYDLSEGKANLIPEERMRKEHPHAWEYLEENKQLLANREHGKFKSSGWWQLYPKNLELWEQPKLLVPYMITDLAACCDRAGLYFVNVTTGGFGVALRGNNVSLDYCTGLLNSSLLDWFLKSVSTTFHGGYFAANKQFIKQLPIRTIDFSNPADVANHDRMVALVEKMLELHKRLQDAGSAADREVVSRQIAATDAEIDRLVYDLYGLTDEEIRIVEGK
jgi:type I restriction-modification system DNA methylase subunit